MKNIYFIGLPTRAKGLEDFDELSRKLSGATFWWFTNSKVEQSHYPKLRFEIGLDDEQLINFIQQKMDLFLCCSKMEGFSLPLAEAIALKKPVIAYRLPEIEATYGDRIEYIDLGDINGMKQRLEGWIKKLDYQKDPEQAKQWIKSEFDPNIVVQRLFRAITIDREPMER